MQIKICQWARQGYCSSYFFGPAMVDPDLPVRATSVANDPKSDMLGIGISAVIPA
jgi:hypothetical protein